MADDSTGDAIYTAAPNFTENVIECRNKLVSEVETLLNRVTNWGRLNLVQFNPTKTQVCAFTAKKIPFVVSPLFEDTSLTASASIGILGVDISSDVQFRDHLEGKAKLASKKLGVFNRSRMYFTPAHRLQLYKAQVRPHMEYCSHLWAGAPQYQLLPLDRIQRRAARIVDDQDLSDQLDPLALRRDVASLCVFYRIYHGECSEELFGLIPAAAFRHRTSRQKFHPHHLDAWLSTTQCFRTDTTQKPSKKERTPSLKAGIAFVILLVLQVSMSDGDHLPSGEPPAQAGFGVYPAKCEALPGLGPSATLSVLRLTRGDPRLALEQEYNFAMLKCFDNTKLIKGPKMKDTLRGWDMPTRYWFWSNIYKNLLKASKEVRYGTMSF
ncbi:hypothetical protein evm_013795 [Chilo suppressalis]|nr:hypothetical protein evm_013795 [Chilo suppressalis]